MGKWVAAFGDSSDIGEGRAEAWMVHPRCAAGLCRCTNAQTETGDGCNAMRMNRDIGIVE